MIQGVYWHARCRYCGGVTCTCFDTDEEYEEQAMSNGVSRLPDKPGFYWALWLTAAPGTHEGDQLTPAHDWEVVEVWENVVSDPCEADGIEKFGVSVPGVRETQWLENFRWGAGPLSVEVQR